MQSALAPAGPAAREIAELTWLLTAGAVVVLIAVIALLLHGALTGPRSAGTGVWVVGGGLAVPFAILSLLLAYSTSKTGGLDDPAPPHAPRIEIVQAFSGVALVAMAMYSLARSWCGRLQRDRRLTFDVTMLAGHYVAAQGVASLAVVHLGPRLFS